MILALLMQAAMHMAHPAPANASSSRIDLRNVPQNQLVEVPTPPAHNHMAHIAAADLVAPTIAYCERTRQARCENSVSALSGGSTVVVCKIAGRWVVNRCR